MSDFASLKRQRVAKNAKSFAASSAHPPPSAASNATETTKTAEERQNETADESEAIKDIDQRKSSSDIDVKPALPSSSGLYASLPSSLAIRTSADRGRGLYSKYARRPGDVLLAVKAHAAALSAAKLADYCSCCGAARQGALRRCTGCKVVYYCDASCQSRDWVFHKLECAAIQRWSDASRKTEGDAPVVPADAIRCLARMVWRKQKLGADSIWAKEIDALESHRTSLSKDPNSQNSQMYAQLAHALVNFLGIASPQDMAAYALKSAADLVDLISRFTTNTFTISTPSLEPLGACVSPSVALINHSCDPNAVVVFPRSNGETRKEAEPLMQVFALKYISPDEEILTSYIDTTLPRDKRQKILQETYHFTCKCALCAPAVDAPVDMREAIWCPKKCGGVCPLPTEENSLTRCSRCKAPLKDTDAVLDAVRVGQEALDKAEALQVSDPEKSTQLTTKLIPILISAGLVPGSHPLLALARLNASLLITHLPAAPDPAGEEVHSSATQASAPTSRGEAQAQLDDAICAAARASAGLGQVLAEGHPVRGIALAELGKLLSVDEPDPAHARSPAGRPTGAMGVAVGYPPSGSARVKFAYETLLRARAELLVGFGSGANEGGVVGRGVREMVAELEKEMQVWKAGAKNVLDDQREAGRR